MSFFETLLNLDCELACLATKAFVAKEEFVDRVFYPTPATKPLEETKESEKPSENQSTTSTTEPEPVKGRGRKLATSSDVKLVEDKKVNIKECADTFADLLAKVSEQEGGEAMVASLLEDMKQVSDTLNDFMNRSNDEKQKLLQQANSTHPVITPIPEHNGMDFSGLVNGVTFDKIPLTPVVTGTDDKPPVVVSEGARPVTQEDLDAAGVPKPEQTPVPDTKKKK